MMRSLKCFLRVFILLLVVSVVRIILQLTRTRRQSRRHGETLVGLAPKQSSKTPQIEIRNTIN